jgi:hypothetical protein
MLAVCLSASAELHDLLTANAIARAINENVSRAIEYIPVMPLVTMATEQSQP